MNIAETIAPKSDQQNFDDYQNGPRTVTISEVKAGSAEQPVELHLVEFPGRPYKPAKSMRRVLVQAWGQESSVYAGRRLKLVGDPTVRFGSAVVGGIRIEALSHIDKPLTMNLTVSKGKRSPYTVQPLPDAPAPSQRPSNAITADQLKQLTESMKANGFTDKDSWLAYLSQTVGRDVPGTKELTKDEGDLVLHELNNAPAGDES